MTDASTHPTAPNQYTLPGVRAASVPGEPIRDPIHPPEDPCGTETAPLRCSATPQRVTPCHPSPLTPCRVPGDTMSPYPKASDDPEVRGPIHHGDAALGSLPGPDPTLQKTPAWLAFKEQLRNELSAEEWDLWVRPMYLQKAIPLGAGQSQLLAAVPRNGRIVTAALNRLPLMRELLKPAGVNISLTHYDREISEARRRYDKHLAPKPWTREGSA